MSVNPFSRLDKGGVTILVLSLAIVFSIIAATSAQLVTRQNRETIDQEQEEQAFGLADAGVYYTQWLLDPNGAALSVDDLLNNPPSETTNHAITTNGGETIGTFTITFLAGADNDFIDISVEGKDFGVDICQDVMATLTRFDTEEFLITDWEHDSPRECS